MKKLFLTLALLVSVVTLSAQGFQVTEKETGKIVESGATYYIFDDGSSYWGVGEELFIEFNVTASEDVMLRVEKIQNNFVENSLNTFCFGKCYGADTFVSDTISISANDTEPYSMHYSPDYLNDPPYTYLDILGQRQSMTYYLYPVNNPDDKFIINVFFQYSLENVEDNTIAELFSNAYPVPACDVVNFDYSFNAGVDAEIAIYNMMGQEVLRNEINSLSGKASINVCDLADGVYFYSLIVNGKTEKSSKLVVRH